CTSCAPSRLWIPRLWAAVAIALLIAAPNLVWQALHGFPMLQVAANIAAGGSTSWTPPVSLVPGVLFAVGRVVGGVSCGENRADCWADRVVAIGPPGNRCVVSGGFLDLCRVPADHRRQGVLSSRTCSGVVGRRGRA